MNVPPAPRHAPHSTVDLLTFQLNPGGRLVYVSPPPDYDAAISTAREVFPELATLEAAKISFRITTSVQGNEHPVTIAPSAWGNVLTTLARFEIIIVYTKPEDDTQQGAAGGKCEEGPPTYSRTAATASSCSGSPNPNTRSSTAQRVSTFVGKFL